MMLLHEGKNIDQAVAEFDAVMRGTVIRLPFPPSVNEMYLNNKGKGKGRIPAPILIAWRSDAGWVLKAQKPKKITARCEIRIDLDERRQGDCANREKAVVDLLVAHGVIQGDQNRFVKRVNIGWEPVNECLVTITEAK